MILGGFFLKCIAVLGSPRSMMNTELLLEHVILGLRQMDVEVEKIKLKDLIINPCIA